MAKHDKKRDQNQGQNQGQTGTGTSGAGGAEGTETTDAVKQTSEADATSEFNLDGDGDTTTDPVVKLAGDAIDEAAAHAATRAANAAAAAETLQAKLESEADAVLGEIKQLEEEHQAIGDPLAKAREIGQQVFKNTQTAMEFCATINAQNAELNTEKSRLERDANKVILPRKHAIEKRLKVLRARAEEIGDGLNSP